MFCCVEIPDSPLLLIRLGNICSPYPGIVFTPSSGYKTPVFKDDGTIWNYDDLCLRRVGKHSNIYIKEILCSKSNTFTIGGRSSIYVPASGCPQGGGNDNHGAEEDKGHGHSNSHSDDGHSDDNDPDHSNHEDDPDSDPGDAGNGDPSTPGISFSAQVKLFEDTSNSSSSQPFQVIEIKGTLVVQTIPGQLNPKWSLSKSHVKFRQLEFQSVKSKSASLAYEQFHVGVEINANDENTNIDVLQPFKTPAFNQETKETTAKKATTSGTAMVSVGATPSVSFFGNKLREIASSTEHQKHHSRITEYDSDGLISWGFCVDDVNEQQSGIGFGRHRAHPSVIFKFFGTKDTGPPPPPPAYFDVLVTSYWSLVSEGRAASGWFCLRKAKTTLYSNFCQAVRLEVPSGLSEETFNKSVSEMNELGNETTTIRRAGLYNFTPTILNLGNQPVESGRSYSPLLLQRMFS